MTITAIERQLMNAVHPIQLERRKAVTSWNDVAFVNRTMGPTLDITFDKLDEYIPVDRWRSGNPNLGQAEIVSDTGTIKAFFYGTEYKIPFWENWLRENAVQNPNASLFGGTLNAERYNMQRMIRRLVAEIERQIDTDFYSGNAKIEFPGMLALDASPDGMSADLTTADGRKEFVDTLVQIKSDGATALQSGRVVLAIDHAALPWLTLPYQTGLTDEASRNPTMDFVRSLVDRIVPVQNAAMSKSAFLHWEDPENVEVFDLTPQGVQILAGEPRRGEDQRVRIFQMWTAKEYRADTVQEITDILP